ncbi:MAG: hypothetical protein ABJA02_04515, partial [Acidobacteriota bacterium]
HSPGGNDQTLFCIDEPGIFAADILLMTLSQLDSKHSRRNRATLLARRKPGVTVIIAPKLDLWCKYILIRRNDEMSGPEILEIFEIGTSISFKKLPTISLSPSILAVFNGTVSQRAISPMNISNTVNDRRFEMLTELPTLDAKTIISHP